MRLKSLLDNIMMYWGTGYRACTVHLLLKDMSYCKHYRDCDECFYYGEHLLQRMFVKLEV